MTLVYRNITLYHLCTLLYEHFLAQIISALVAYVENVLKPNYNPFLNSCDGGQTVMTVQLFKPPPIV